MKFSVLQQKSTFYLHFLIITDAAHLLSPEQDKDKEEDKEWGFSCLYMFAFTADRH